MKMTILTTKCALFVLFIYLAATVCEETEKRQNYKLPKVVLSILIRNKAHTLPYFFTCLEQLDYPKDRLFVWIHSDYNQDNSPGVITKWVDTYRAAYSGVNVTIDSESGPLHSDEDKPKWSRQHFKHIIRLREAALDFARKKWADYVFMLDADVFLTEAKTLKLLISKNLPVTAPMLISDGLYSNFWCGMSDDFYYKRTDDYKPILKMETTGCFAVPMVHSAVLIDLNVYDTDNLSYDPKYIKDYRGPEDDIIAFAVNAKNNGVPLYICNDNVYGFIPVPLEDDIDTEYDTEQLLNVKLEALSRGQSLPLNQVMKDHVTYPDKSKLNCDEIYLINLERRSERRQLMESSFKELGMDAKLFVAVDGRNIDLDNLKELSVELLPNYEDPFHKRPMKTGEIGCFLSHYGIWQQIINNGHKTSLVLEDDVHFMPYFRQKFMNLLKQLESMEWDLVYIGRKILSENSEIYVTDSLVKPLYSYWTLGYLLSLSGAKKLVNAQPLSKVLPVDEFLPIMFDQHPNATWKSHFPARDLKAYSASPLLIFPTHYTGQKGYVSDTEASHVLQESSLTRSEL